MNIVWLDEQACADPRMTGGKAASLSELAPIFQIPPGFCLTTTMFDHAVATGLIPDQSMDNPISSAVSSLRASPLYDELLAAYRHLSERVDQDAAATAVRSSGVDED